MSELNALSMSIRVSKLSSAAIDDKLYLFEESLQSIFRQLKEEHTFFDLSYDLKVSPGGKHTPQ